MASFMGAKMSQFWCAFHHVIGKSILDTSHPFYVVNEKLNNETTGPAYMQGPNPTESG
jgi:hypothetical protein